MRTLLLRGKKMKNSNMRFLPILLITIFLHTYSAFPNSELQLPEAPIPSGISDQLTTENQTTQLKNETIPTKAFNRPTNSNEEKLELSFTVQDALQLFTKAPRQVRTKIFESFSELLHYSKVPRVKITINTILDLMKLQEFAARKQAISIPSINNYFIRLANVNPLRNAKEQLYTVGVHGVANVLDTVNQLRKVATDAAGDTLRFGNVLVSPVVHILPLRWGDILKGRMNDARMRINDADGFLTNANDDVVKLLKNYAAMRKRMIDERRKNAERGW